MQAQTIIHPEFTTIDGHRIRYAASRREGRPQLLLTSPQPQSILTYEQWWARLSEQFDLVAVDLPNHGHSAAAAEITTVSQQATFFSKILDHFGLERPHLVAPDVGTPISLRFMADNSGRIKSAILGDAGCVGPVDGNWVFRRLVYSPTFQQLTLLAGGTIGGRIYCASANSVGYKRYSPPNYILQDYLAGSTDIKKLRRQVKFLGSYADETPQLAKDVPSIETPILVLHGEHDTFVSASNSWRLHKLLPYSEFDLIEGAGHYAWEDNAEEYIAHVLCWIDFAEVC